MCSCRMWTHWTAETRLAGIDLCIYVDQSTATVLGIVASCDGPQLAQARSDRLGLPRAYWFVDGNTARIAYTLWEGVW